MTRISFSLIGETCFGFSTLLYLSITLLSEQSLEDEFVYRETEKPLVNPRKMNREFPSEPHWERKGR